jgi:hypothetical protein
MNKSGRKKGLTAVPASNSNPFVREVVIRIADNLRLQNEKPSKRTPCNQHTICTEWGAERIFTVQPFLTWKECSYFIQYAEEIGFEECEQKQTREYAQRNNGRIQVVDGNLAERIFSRLFPVLPAQVDGMKPCGCSSNIRFYRYTVGQSFGKHVDESHYDEHLRGTTVYTLLIYLNGTVPTSSFPTTLDAPAAADSSLPTDLPQNDCSANEHENNHCVDDRAEISCVGGETVFYKGHGDKRVLLEVRPVQGMLLLHGHGARCLTHEGRVVTEGVKYVLRTDVTPILKDSVLLLLLLLLPHRTQVFDRGNRIKTA